MPQRLTTPQKKKAVLKLLFEGAPPGCAAEAVGVARSTVYEWQKTDPIFAAKCNDAVATGIDKLESVAYKKALDGDNQMLTLMLKGRRADVYNRQPVGTEVSASHLNLTITTLHDALTRVDRLGLPAPVIEYDDYSDL